LGIPGTKGMSMLKTVTVIAAMESGAADLACLASDPTSASLRLTSL
jgi:hypothetical protein